MMPTGMPTGLITPYFGTRVILNSVLPIYPTDGEVGRRIVRNGLADVLAWLGEDVGPKPDAKTHALHLPGNVMVVSPELYERLRREATP